jgi:hypothetical protein
MCDEDRHGAAVDFHPLIQALVSRRIQADCADLQQHQRFDVEVNPSARVFNDIRVVVPVPSCSK